MIIRHTFCLSVDEVNNPVKFVTIVFSSASTNFLLRLRVRAQSIGKWKILLWNTHTDMTIFEL